MQVEIKGGKALEAALGEIAKTATRRNIAIRGLTKAAEVIADRARQLAPKDQGDLEQSIKVSPTAYLAGKKSKRGGNGGDFGDVVEVFVGIDASVNKALTIYAPINEFGNDPRPKQPYMRPAFDQTGERALDLMISETAAETEKAIARAARRNAKG